MALDINPNYALALSNLSSLLFQNQRATEGLELLKRCLSLHPDYIPALEQMAGWHLINQNESAAITLANRILKIDPQNRNAIRIKQSMTNVR
jgi:tetratricopeptide (TPR) repeat protein